jgi:tetratricopeptide (TPR) repeat protein
MGYYGLIMMGHAYKFIGDITKTIESYKKAELFCSDRNEHLMYLAICLEEQKRYEDILPIIDEMDKKVNPFPNRTFLIENRCYHNTGNLLNEYRESINRKMNEHVMDLTSVKFDFE